MKKVFNKTFAAIVLAVAMVLALFSGLFLINRNELATADGSVVNVKFESDAKTFSKGKSFDVTITVTSPLTNSYFKSLTLYVGVLNTAKTDFDGDKCSKFTFKTPENELDPGMSADFPINRSLNIVGFEPNDVIYTSADYATNGLLKISVGDAYGDNVPCSEEVVFRFGLTIANDVTDGSEFDIGIITSSINSYSYQADGASKQTIVNAADSSKFSVQPLHFVVKEPSTNNNLGALKGGQGTTESDLDDIDFSDPDNLAITVTDPTKPISILPTAEDNEATIKLKTKDTPDGKDAESGKITSIDIPDDGVVDIVVKAGDGTEKTYKLKVTVVGATLTALTADTDTKETGTSEGVQETFDPKTLAYTVNVPNDSTKVTITATVSTGNSASTTIGLEKTKGTYTIPASATSGTAFDVTGVADGDKLTLKAQADNGTTSSEKKYVITFEVLDVDTAATLTVVGATSLDPFTNDATKATEKGVDFYYVITGETNAASKVSVNKPTTAKEVLLDGAAYTVAQTLEKGEHTVKVTAEAGNSKEYKFILKNYTPIQLKSGITADFIYEQITSDSALRKSYKETGKKHGIDDLDYERLVIGNIAEKTSVNAFLNNFENDVKNSIKLYNAAGTLVYNQGSAEGGYDLDSTDKAVGTSWKLEYIVDGDVEETIYLSVLGDLNCDGKVSSFDISAMSKVIKEVPANVQTFLANVELRLASYITNTTSLLNGKPSIAATEIVPIGAHIRLETAISEYFKAS